MDQRRRLLSPTLAAFAGRAVINGGTGALSGLRGVLQIEGTVDVTTGLATYGYAGDIHFGPVTLSARKQSRPARTGRPIGPTMPNETHAIAKLTS